MKIVLLSTSDISGGAAIAASRMAVALRKQGHEVHLLVLFKRSKETWVVPIAGESWFAERLRDVQYFITQKFLVKSGHQLSLNPWNGNDVSRHPLVQAADVIQLHWINHGFMGMRELKALFALQKPIFWHMHDYWAFTGGCHYPGNCRKFELGCSNCPALKFSGNNDATASQHFLKKELFQLNRPTLVGASHWLAEEAKRAALSQYANVAHVPNPIDASFYAVGSNEDIRKRHGISANEKTVLFAAMNTTDPRKGFFELKEALAILKRSCDLPIHLLVAGKSTLPINLPYKATFMGTLNAFQMRGVYQAADLFVIPSLEENLPNTVLESLASGTPVVGFEVGGIPEMVVNGKSGYLAKEVNPQSLAAAIEMALRTKWPMNFNEVVAGYSESSVVERYVELIKK